MKFGTRLFLAYFAVIALGIGLFLYTAQDEIRPAVRQASEEALVDTANLLAEVAATHMAETFDPQQQFAAAMERYQTRALNADIWGQAKLAPDFEVYVTDLAGEVIYHSDKTQIGEDYSQWRDVYLTLKGEYGARTSGADPSKEALSTMFVAAPIYRNGDIIGVLTVSQPNEGIQPFLNMANQRLRQISIAVLVGAFLLALFMSQWFSRSIGRLHDYVDALRQGKTVPVPDINERELKALADATEAMRKEIDGKAYVEDYIHSLTHELKSPLSAIVGAVEILEDAGLDNTARERFLSNIRSQSHRLQLVIDQLLDLASLEKKDGLENPISIDLKALISDAIEGKLPQLSAKSIRLSHNENSPNATVIGDKFLLAQAFSNLLDNAIDFCPHGGAIDCKLTQQNEKLIWSIENEGEPVPSYAINKVFDRFFSLARPGTGERSSGLGLSFVRQVLSLHKADVRLLNTQTGVHVELKFIAFRD